ncbi:MAG TPA: 3-hydroxyacyl-CoA dehydrogenase NAD-binding domain-containing protein [Thermomicrobiales bacterium]|nr:3-hydroxyacyl-CoA dehydrogenase NAD-binding domain-containing protein [Thermomicrobiales bacterium]
MTVAGITRVAVVGAGTMGQGIAQVFATARYEVTVVDSAPGATDRAIGALEKALSRSVDRGRMTSDERDATLGRIATSTDLGAVGGHDLVVEAVFEQLDVKRDVFRVVAPLLGDDALLVSNTSSLSISALAGGLPAPDHFAGLHFFNPVPVLPLVEIVRGLATSDDTVTRLTAVVESLGKSGVVVRDSPGFIVNRVLIPMINEAVTCLEHGVANRDAIDASMRLGANHPMGPLQLADLIGLDVCLHIMEALHTDLGEDRYRPAPLLRRMVAAGYLGRKSGQGFHDYAE